jgi:hypothetical protein
LVGAVRARRRRGQTLAFPRPASARCGRNWPGDATTPTCNPINNPLEVAVPSPSCRQPPRSVKLSFRPGSDWNGGPETTVTCACHPRCSCRPTATLVLGHRRGDARPRSMTVVRRRRCHSRTRSAALAPPTPPDELTKSTSAWPCPQTKHTLVKNWSLMPCCLRWALLWGPNDASRLSDASTALRASTRGPEMPRSVHLRRVAPAALEAAEERSPPLGR